MSDTGYAPSVWEFDEEVTRVFDDMLDRSVPQFQTMRNAVTEVGLRHVTPETTIVDLGCSRGGALAPFVDRLAGGTNTFVGVESSEPMATAAARRFSPLSSVEISHQDLRSHLPLLDRPASVVLSVLTLMFVPVNYRQRIVSWAHSNLKDGGALVVVEKVLGASAELDEEFVEIYHEAKRRTGYTPDEIERKQLSLEGVLVPLTASWNEELLRSAGFSEIDNFWSWFTFRGWVAVKRESR